jgi:hypothetical protein
MINIDHLSMKDVEINNFENVENAVQNGAIVGNMQNDVGIQDTILIDSPEMSAEAEFVYTHHEAHKHEQEIIDFLIAALAEPDWHEVRDAGAFLCQHHRDDRLLDALVTAIKAESGYAGAHPPAWVWVEGLRRQDAEKTLKAVREIAESADASAYAKEVAGECLQSRLLG